MNAIRKSPPRPPQLDPALGADVPELGSQAGQWDQILWHGLRKSRELECQVYPVTGARGQRWFWVNAGRIVEVTGPKEQLKPLYEWLQRVPERGWWTEVARTMRNRGRGIGKPETRTRSLTNRRAGLRSTVWSAAHRLAWLLYDPDMGAPGQHLVRDQATGLRDYLPSRDREWWTRGDLIGPGPIDEAQQLRDQVLAWIADLYASPRPWAWWLRHFVTRGYTGTEVVRPVGGKTRNATRVLASLLLPGLQARDLTAAVVD